MMIRPPLIWGGNSGGVHASVRVLVRYPCLGPTKQQPLTGEANPTALDVTQPTNRTHTHLNADPGPYTEYLHPRDAMAVGVQRGVGEGMPGNGVVDPREGRMQGSNFGPAHSERPLCQYAWAPPLRLYPCRSGHQVCPRIRAILHLNRRQSSIQIPGLNTATHCLYLSIYLSTSSIICFAQDATVWVSFVRTSA